MMKTLEEVVNQLPKEIRLPIYEALQIVKEDIIRRELGEIKEEIKNVWKAINELAEAQKRTEQRVNELAEAQKRTEERVDTLAQRLNELTQRVNELAEAQKRTEERVNKLSREVEKLSAEVRKIAESHFKLVEEHKKTREQLGGLSHAFGYVLEDRAIKSLPKVLKENHKIEVMGKLKRDYLVIDGEYIEVNIYGKGKKEGKEYTIIGEAKSKVSKRIIDKFIKKCNKISEKSIKVIISYIFTPEIKKYAEEKNIILIPSYELEL